MMDLPWTIGAVAALIFFGVFEYRALAHPDRQNTLSRCIAQLGASWPFSIWLMGLLCGALAAHFFWAWPQNPLAGGG